MFTWGNSGNNPLEPFPKRSPFQLCDDDQNPISKQDHDDNSFSPFFSNFPSPFFDEHELPLNQIFMPPHHYLVMPENHHSQSADQTPKKSNPTKKEASAKCSLINGASKLKEKADDRKTISSGLVVPSPRRRNLGVNVGAAPRKRTGKKDRHSKICTAQGIRDRRMRLSLQVARKFFDLQDMLGYDKASKTIEWLFNKSKKAIKDLAKDNDNPQRNHHFSMSDAKSESLFSECEVVSGIEENFSNNHHEIVKEGGMVSNNARSLLCVYNQNSNCEKDAKTPLKTACKLPNMRESREKARARARCRTREKMMIKGLENLSQWCKSSPNNHNDLEKLLGSSSNNSPFDQESYCSHNLLQDQRVSSYCAAADYYSSIVTNQLSADVGTIEKFLGNYSSNSLSTSNCPISDDYHHNNCSADAVSCCIDPNNSNFSNMGFRGNWELWNNERVINSSQYAVTNQVSILAGNSAYSSGISTLDFHPSFHQ